MPDTHIEFRDIDKVFPGQHALKAVSFAVERGEVHALLGENGAGKSTLLNILHGIFAPTRGAVLIDGKPATFANVHDAIGAGVIKVHQEINLVPEMTVLQNIFLGCEITRHGLVDRRAMQAETQKLLASLGCRFGPDERVKFLNVGEMQMVQIAKAIHLRASIVSFDEPTSSLTDREVETLFQVILRLKAEGITILYISHKLDEIYRICDRATVLRDGAYIATFPVAGLPKERLIKSMVGRDVAMFAKRHRPRCVDWQDVMLRVINASGNSGFRNVTFDLHRGEILGFFGLVGAGRTETMRGVFGADRLTSGAIELHGREVAIKSPADATAHRIGLAPENRKTQGFVKVLNNRDNIALASLDKFQVGPFQSHSAKAKHAAQMGDKVNLTPNDPAFFTANLSGGNQQKVVIAKWLTTDADILMLDEPTKGIDVGAKSEIYALMEELVHQGKGIIMVSGELPEIIGMSDRIVVMHDGCISAILHRDEFDEARILTYAVGGGVDEPEAISQEQ